MPTRQLVKQVVIYIVAISVCVGVFVAANKSSAKAGEELSNNAANFATAMPVTVLKVKAHAIAESCSYPGTIRSSVETKLAFRVSGPLVKLDVRPGDMVKEGQLMLQIDPRDFQDRIAVLMAQKESVQSQLENAKQDYKRSSKLFNENVTTQENYDHAVNALAAAKAGLKAVESQLVIARHQLQDTELRAPYDGIVSEQFVENYEIVNAGTTVLVVQDISILEIDVFVPENKIADYKLSQDLQGSVTFPAFSNRIFSAELVEWQIGSDPVTKTYRLTFSMPNLSDIQIMPGMSTNVIIEPNNSQRQSITVPESCVLNEREKSFIWLYSESSQKACKCFIKLAGYYGQDDLVVSDGVNDGDMVVVQGYTHIDADTSLQAAIIEQ